jgi:hypothetical protein
MATTPEASPLTLGLNPDQLLKGVGGIAALSGLAGGYLSSRGKTDRKETPGQRRKRIVLNALLSAGAAGTAAYAGAKGLESLMRPLPASDVSVSEGIADSPLFPAALAGGGALAAHQLPGGAVEGQFARQSLENQLKGVLGTERTVQGKNNKGKTVTWKERSKLLPEDDLFGAFSRGKNTPAHQQMRANIIDQLRNGPAGSNVGGMPDAELRKYFLRAGIPIPEDLRANIPLTGKKLPNWAHKVFDTLAGGNFENKAVIRGMDGLDRVGFRLPRARLLRTLGGAGAGLALPYLGSKALDLVNE